MRIACSGPAHNLITWLILWLLAFNGSSRIFWKTQSTSGVVVQDVDWVRTLSPADVMKD